MTMLALFHEISLRHWLRAPFRSGLVVVGIALGVALYVATGAASQSMFAAFKEFTKHVSTRADLSVVSNSEGLPNALIGPLADVPGVAHVAASVEFGTQAPDLGESVMVLGVDLLGDLHFLPYETNEGEEQQVVDDPLAFVNDPSAVLVTEGFAKRHKLCEGSEFQLLTSEGPKEFSVYGLLSDAGPGAAFGNQVVIMFMDAAQVSFAKGHMADRIDVALETGADRQAVRERLLAVVGPGFTIESPEQMAGHLQQLAKPLESALWMSGFLALLVGGFLVYNAVGVAVAQRRREIAMLRTFGVTRSAATWLFTWESALLAIPGVLLGLWIGHVLARFSAQQTLDVLDRMFFAMPKTVPHLSPKLAMEGTIAGFSTALIAGYFPARRGASIEPAVVLRQSGGHEERSRRPRFYIFVAGLLVSAFAFVPALNSQLYGMAAGLSALLVGPALCTATAILLLRSLLLPIFNRLLGVPGRLGLDYVSRSLNRSSVNVMALMVAVAMSVAVGGWLSSFERTIFQWADSVGVADLTVTQGSPLVDRRHVPFVESRLADLDDLPGVAATEKFRIFNQEVLGQTLRVVATELDTFRGQAEVRGKGWRFVEGDTINPGELTASPQVLLSENAADRLGLSVGDKFQLAGPVKPLTVTVRAVIVDYTSETGTVFIDRKFYLQGWDDTAVDALLVYLKNGADEQAVAQQIRRELGDQGSVFVTNSSAVRQQLVDTLRGTFSYSETIELVALFIALMGIVGTMTAAIIDRTRELAMLRAIGATVSQVVVTIIAEAAFLGLCASVMGILVGVAQSKFFLNTFLVQETGFHLELSFPLGAVLRVSLLVTLTSAAAGAISSIRAARADTAAALMR